jgi:hypothetical protein
LKVLKWKCTGSNHATVYKSALAKLPFSSFTAQYFPVPPAFGLTQESADFLCTPVVSARRSFCSERAWC